MGSVQPLQALCTSAAPERTVLQFSVDSVYSIIATLARERKSLIRPEYTTVACDVLITAWRSLGGQGAHCTGLASCEEEIH